MRTKLAGFFSILLARSTPGPKSAADKRLAECRGGREAERSHWGRGNQCGGKTRLISRWGCSRLSSRGGRFDLFCQQYGRLCSAYLRKQALCLAGMCTVRVFLSQQRQLLAGPIVCPEVMVAQCQKVQGIGRDRLVWVEFYDLFEAMCSGEIRATSIIELTDEEVCLCQEVVTVLDPLECWAVVPASGKIFPDPFEGFEGFLNGSGITLDSLCQLQLAFSDAEDGIGGQDMGAMEIEEMGILDDGLLVFLFLEKRLPSFHDDVRVVVFLDPIAEENLLVSAAQGFFRCVLGLGRARAGGGNRKDRETEAKGHGHSSRRNLEREAACHHCRKM
jgi:hypothetical protein